MILEKHVYSLDNLRRGSYYICATLNPAMQPLTVLVAQDDEIRKMQEWCEQTGIQFTPTFFVNNHQLPELYSVSDLRYLLSE